MSLFPSMHEREITVAIIGTGVGLAVGLVVAALGRSEDLVTELIPLVAAFVGAWSAFMFEKRRRDQARKAEHLTAANQLLFALMERIDLMGNFSAGHIAEHRESPGRMMEIPPAAGIRVPPTEIRAAEIPHLFRGKDKELLLRIHESEMAFSAALTSIRIRSELHLNQAQPAIDRAGWTMDREYVLGDVRRVLGERLYYMLESATDQMIDHVDQYLERATRLQKELGTAFSAEFEPQDLYLFQLKSKQQEDSQVAG